MNKLADELSKKYSIDIAGAGNFYAANWIGIAKYVERLLLEARINECSEHLYDSTMSHIRRNELEAQLEKLK